MHETHLFHQKITFSHYLKWKMQSKWFIFYDLTFFGLYKVNFSTKIPKTAGARTGERRSFENLRSAAGAPLPKMLKVGALAGAPLPGKFRSASQSAAPKCGKNRGWSARSDFSDDFNSLLVIHQCLYWDKYSNKVEDVNIMRWNFFVLTSSFAV